MFKTVIINERVYLDYYSGGIYNIHIRKYIDDDSDVNINFIKKAMIEGVNKLKDQCDE